MGAKVLVASIVTGLVFIVVGIAGILLANKFVTSYVSSVSLQIVHLEMTRD